MLFKDAKNYYHAHAYAEAWISPDTQEYLANVFGYGIANTAISDRNRSGDPRSAGAR